MQQGSLQRTSGQVVPFETVISNFGSHYNPDYSTFTCPQNGVYEFGVYITSTAGESAKVSIQRNGVSLASALATAETESDVGAGGTSVATLCFQDDVIETIATAASSFYGGSQVMFTGRWLFTEMSKQVFVE